jgi:hypothetical protein
VGRPSGVVASSRTTIPLALQNIGSAQSPQASTRWWAAFVEQACAICATAVRQGIARTSVAIVVSVYAGSCKGSAGLFGDAVDVTEEFAGWWWLLTQ